MVTDFERHLELNAAKNYVGCPDVQDECWAHQMDVLQEHGLTVEQMLNSFRIFDGYMEVAK